MSRAAELLLYRFIRTWKPAIRKDVPIQGSAAVDFIVEFTVDAEKALKQPEPQLLTRRELAHVLAALRYLQAAEDGQALFGGFKRMPQFREAGIRPRTSALVDRLCERLNAPSS